MSTITAPSKDVPSKPRNLVEMNWDPITRIVGSLGIFTKIDFDAKKVAECHSTSSIFRGYSIFMKGKDPRDAHFITSRICGICGDNHATCATYAQNMAFGVQAAAHRGVDRQPRRGCRVHVRPQHLPGQPGRRGFLRTDGEGNQSQGVDEGAIHGGAALQRSRLQDHRRHHDGAQSVHRLVLSGSAADEPHDARDVLPDGRPPRASFHSVSGRRGTVPTVQLFTDYIVRLMKYVEFMKKVLPLHDDLFDFFYEALPGYEEVGRRRILLGCWGSFNDPEHCDYTYKNMTNWGRKMFVTPGVVVDGKLVTTDLVDINLNIRILLGSSYYDDWKNAETFVKTDPLGNPVDKNHPWNQTTIPRPQKRDFGGQVHLGHVAAVVRQADRRSSRAGYRRRPDCPAMGDGAGRTGGHRLHQSYRQEREDLSAEDHVQARSRVRVEDSAVEQCHRTRSCPHLLPGSTPPGAPSISRRGDGRTSSGKTRTWSDFKVPDEAIGCVQFVNRLYLLLLLRKLYWLLMLWSLLWHFPG